MPQLGRRKIHESREPTKKTAVNFPDLVCSLQNMEVYSRLVIGGLLTIPPELRVRVTRGDQQIPFNPKEVEKSCISNLQEYWRTQSTTTLCLMAYESSCN